MCAVSNVGDAYSQKYNQGISTGQPYGGMGHATLVYVPPVERHEFEALKREVLEMKQELLKAKEEDIKNGEPDCEMEEKVKLLKAVAEAVGVSLDEVFKRG